MGIDNDPAGYARWEAWLGALTDGDPVIVGCAAPGVFLRWQDSPDLEHARVRIGSASVVVNASDLSAPEPAPAELFDDAVAAVAILRRAGWAGARRNGDWIDYAPGYLAIGGMAIYRSNGAWLCNRNDYTLTACARVIVRDAVANGYAPNMDAARAMVAEWGGE